MQKQQTLRPFGARDKFGYMFGDFGNDFTFILSTSILMKFYTDVMGVSAAVVGTIMMLARFVDAVTDVTMGRICDNSKPTAAGKFKPWLLRICVPVAIASFLMYAPGLASEAVAGWSSTVKTIYLVITYLLWGSFCYTGINIPLRLHGFRHLLRSRRPSEPVHLPHHGRHGCRYVHRHRSSHDRLRQGSP